MTLPAPAPTSPTPTSPSTRFDAIDCHAPSHRPGDGASSCDDYASCCLLTTCCPCAVVERVAWDAGLPLVFTSTFIGAIAISANVAVPGFLGLDLSVLTVVLTLTLVFAFWGGAVLTTTVWWLMAAPGVSDDTTPFAETQIVSVVSLSLVVAITRFRWRRLHPSEEDRNTWTEVAFACCFPCCSTVSLAVQRRQAATGTGSADTLPAYVVS